MSAYCISSTHIYQTLPRKMQSPPHSQGPPSSAASYLLFQSHRPSLPTLPAWMFPEHPRLHCTCPPWLRLLPPWRAFPSHLRRRIRHASPSFHTQFKCHVLCEISRAPRSPPYPHSFLCSSAYPPLYAHFFPSTVNPLRAGTTRAGFSLGLAHSRCSMNAEYISRWLSEY